MSAPEAGTAEVLAAATALRWSRPDLAAALAEHLMEAASALSDRDRWLVAAGWRVHAMCATGDGREVAADVVEALPRWGDDVLAGGAADRLRLELAVLAHDSGEPAASHALLEGISTGRRTADPELAADVATARLRCRRDDGPLDPADALAAWDRLGGPAGEIGAATALLVTAATDRRVDRAENAVTRAVDGLGRLDRARTSAHALSPSPHLAAALAAEWISALIAAGRPDQAREGSRPLRERLVEHARPTRQLALLRLTLARVAAVDAPDGADAAKELERAAHDAAASDAPELEYICRTALGEVHETGGRLEAALESVRLAVVAERRHRSRAVRFRAALAATPGLESSDSATGVEDSASARAELRGGSRSSGSRAAGAGRGGADRADDAGSGSRSRYSVADAEPSGRGARPGPGRPSGRTGVADGAAPPGSAERTAILRSVQAASMAEPRSTGELPIGRDPAGTSATRPGQHNGSPTGVGRTPSNGSAANGAAPTGSASASSGAPGAGPAGSGSAGSGSAGTGSAGTGSTGSGPTGTGSTESGTNRSGTNGSRHHGVAAGGDGVAPEGAAGGNPWAILPGSRVDRVNGNGSHRIGGAGGGSATGSSATGGSAAGGSSTNGGAGNGTGTNGRASRRGDTPAGRAGTEPGGSGRAGTEPPGTDDVRPNGRAAHGSGWDLLGPAAGREPRAGEQDSVDTAPVNPWATGAWTVGSPPPRDRSAGDPPVPTAAEAPVAPPDPVASALADPEAWLASALADLDRIWGRRPDGADAPIRDDVPRDDVPRDDVPRDDVPRDGVLRAEPTPPDAEAPPAGCVVVLDLARGGERLPADDAAPTVRRVARRLAQRLPESAHLRRDSPDAVAVVLADGDRAAAAEWMHRVVPALVDGLAVDAAVEGAHLRAAVHDTQGVVGAQVLQRLDGGRSRPARGGTPGRARHAAPGDPSVAEEATGTASRAADDRDGSTRHGTPPGAGSGPPGSPSGGGAAPAESGADGAATGDGASPRDGRWEKSAPGRTGPSGVAPDRRGPDAEAPTPAEDSGSGRPVDARPTADDAVVGRHDEASGRRPYLPDGVVVRPGTGGRRHRRSADPTPQDTEPDTAPPPASAGPQSTEGLGLADLLAGALAAYRGI